MRRKNKILLTLLAILVASLAWFVIVPGVRFSRIRQQYPLGLSFQDALARTPQPYTVSTSGMDIKFSTPEQSYPPRFPHHYVYTQDVILQFNYYDQLIKVSSISSPWHAFQWDNFHYRD